jgi:hypothetical protein
MTTAESSAKAKKLKRIQERFERAQTYERDTRSLERDDMLFANADPDHPQWQWPGTVYKMRNAPGEPPRPCIVVNKVRQHNLQVINDGRENKPSVTVHATGFGATSEAAQVFEGLIRHIEYQSGAAAVYVAASRNQVEIGIGYWRIVTEYPDDDTFDQEIYIRRIADPHSVYLDPDAQAMDKSDARWGIIFRDMPRDQFEQEYSKYKDLAGCQSMEGDRSGGWRDKDVVRIAEYYERSSISDTLWAVPPDHVHPGHPGGMLRESKMIDGLPDAVKAAGYQSREVEDHRVTWTMVVGEEIVEEQDTAFAYIPIVPLIGEEVIYEGKLDRRGHTRALKDAQRMYNYNAALKLDTPLPTPTGWTTIGDVKPGEFLLDEDGRPAEVLGVSPTFINKKCYRVEFSGGSQIVADIDHKWTVEERGKRKGNTFDWSNKTISTGELTPGKHFIYATKPLDLPDVDLPIHPYILGMWLGDGDTAGPRITSGAVDMHQIRALILSCGYQASETRVYPDGSAAATTVYGLRKQLSDAKLLGNKHIPAAYLRASREQREMLLQGLMDTDGTVTKGAQCVFTNVNQAISDGLMEILRSLGIQATSTRVAAAVRMFPSGQPSSCQAYNRISFSTDPSIQTFRLERHLKRQGRQRPLHPRRTKRHRIISVTEVPSVPVRCLGVNTPNHLFLAGEGMVPTHNSAAIEFGALQTKTPWVTDVRAIEGYEQYWATANTQNHAYLPYNSIDDTGQPTIKPPERTQPPTSAPIYMEAMQVAEQQMMIASGQYQAQMGAESNERTGIAIQERQRQGDKATYHFIDQLGIAIAYTGRILVDLIPKVMDTKRVAMVLGEDGSRKQVQVDPNATVAHQTVQPPSPPQTSGPPGLPTRPGMQPAPPPAPAQNSENLDASIIFNPAIGKYAVEAEMGPAFATRREEAFNAFQQIIAQNAALAPIIGDLMFKAADFPMADEISERLHNMVPPQALGGPSPQEQQMQAAIQHLTGQLTQLQSVNSQAMKELADEKARAKLAGERNRVVNDNKIGDISIDRYKAETDRIRAMIEADPDTAIPLLRATILQSLRETHGGSAEISMTLPHPNAPPTPPPVANDPDAPPPQTGTGP